MRRALIAAVAGLVATILLVVGFDPGPGPPAAAGRGGMFGPLAPPPTPVVPPEYRDWIKRSAKQCKQVTQQLVASQIHQESRFDRHAVSVTGAQGIAQFMPKTWKSWGRDSDDNGKTSPLDPADAIMAQGRLMCSLAKKASRTEWRPGTVELALAGYNAGWGAVSEHRGIPPYPETRAYVSSVMSLMDSGVPVMSP